MSGQRTGHFRTDPSRCPDMAGARLAHRDTSTRVSGFSAVVTTGIYCRPGMLGTPEPGQRAPFRCSPPPPRLPASAPASAAGRTGRRRRSPASRPRSSAVPSGWWSTGTCGSDSEAALADRLGVSARHLRRLFQDQVGVTPSQLARSSRAHFARRLLDDTDLSITEIAFASGFGSLRQFNRTLHEIFRATPRELRGRRRVADRLVADGGLASASDLRRPTRLGGDARIPRRSSDLRCRACLEAGVYRRTVPVDGDPGAIEVAMGGSDHLRAHRASAALGRVDPRRASGPPHLQPRLRDRPCQRPAGARPAARAGGSRPCPGCECRARGIRSR